MITLPTIHLNGTSANSLYESYDGARREIRRAICAFNLIEFNRRDYYPVPGSWEKALEERQKHYQMLEEIDVYLLTVMEHCQESIDAKTARSLEQVKGYRHAKAELEAKP